MTEITKEEALKQGYTLCGKPNEDYQHLILIQDLNEIDLDGSLVVADKESYYTPSIDTEDLADLIAEHLESQHGSETRDDTEEVYRIVKSLDFSKASEMINESLKDKQYYMLTKIKLVK